MVEGLRRRNGGDAGNRSVLGGAVPDIGGLRAPSERGQRTSHQNAPGAEDRRLGMPVVTKATHLPVAEQFLPTSRRDLGVAHLHAAAGEVGDGGPALASNTCKKH